MSTHCCGQLSWAFALQGGMFLMYDEEHDFVKRGIV